MVPYRNTLGALFPEVYLRDVLGCSTNLNGLLERVPRWALPFASGNMPCISTMTASSDPLLAVLVADTTISLESPGVPPSCPTGLNACSLGTCRAGKSGSSVYYPASLTTLHSEITKCSAFSSRSSNCSSSSTSGDESGDSSASASETCWELCDEFENEATVEDLKAAADFLYAAQIGEAERGFLALDSNSLDHLTP